MNITKQRKRRQKPTDKTEKFWLAVREPVRRLKKMNFWKRRKLPKPSGDTVVFRRFEPYQPASPDRLAQKIAITRELFAYGLQKSNEQLTP